jgi:hypothetical protein
MAQICPEYVNKRNRQNNEKVAGQCKGTFVQGQGKSGKEITESDRRRDGDGPNVLERNYFFYESGRCMMFCWFYKFMISHVQDGGGSPSGITKKHIRRCEDCRQFYKTCQSLGERLTREAEISCTRLSMRLSEHILRAIPGRCTEAQKVGMKFWISAVAACLALILLIGALLLVVRPSGRDDIQPGRLQMAIAIQELRTVYEQVGQDLQIIRPGIIEKPLANEFKCLTNDTQSAVRFLVACVDVDIANAESGSLN